jgi:hypothetical protein
MRVTYSLRALVAAMAMCAVIALLLRAYVASPTKPFVEVKVTNGASDVYLNDRFLGVSPVALSYEEFIEACGGRDRIQMDASLPTFGIKDFGAMVEGLRHEDGMYPIITLAPEKGYRQIGTPFGPATLVHSLIHIGGDERPHIIELTKRQPISGDVELHVVRSESGLLQCTIRAPRALASAKEAVVWLNIRTRASYRPQEVRKEFNPSNWALDNDRIVGVFDLPPLEPGDYWLTGSLNTKDDSENAPTSRNAPLALIPEYFVVPK